MIERIELHSSYSCDEVSALFKNLAWLMDGVEAETLFDGRNRIAKVKVTVNGAPQLWAIKRFGSSGLYKKLLYRLRSSKAERSFRRGIELPKAGFHTPEPVGFREVISGGFIIDSYYVSRFYDYDFEVRAFFRGEKTACEKIGAQQLYRQLGEYARSLHKQGFYHHDFTDGNILVDVTDGTCVFSLIDLNRMSRRKVGLSSGIRNLVKLNIPEEHRRFFVQSYCGTLFDEKHWQLYRVFRTLHLMYRDGKKPWKKFRKKVKGWFAPEERI